jgi:mono/diheme cytochrome c family protein
MAALRASAVCALLAAAVLYPTLASPHAATSNTVLFDREIVRILNEHCAMCHFDGGVAVPLASYEETWLRRKAIHDRVLARHMPPWAAEPGYGRFANANVLTLREMRFIVSWVEGLAPRNSGTVFLNVLDPNAAPRGEVAASTDFDAWQLGEPDLVVPIALPAATRETARDTTPAVTTPNGSGGRPQTRVLRTVVDTAAGAGSRLTGLEYRPADRSLLRAVVFSLEDSGQWLATWTPWFGYRQLPDGLAYALGAGARIAIEVHALRPGPGVGLSADPNSVGPGLGNASPDNPLADDPSFGDLGLHFAAAAAPAASTDAVVAPDIVLTGVAEIPPATRRHGLRAEARLERAVDALALWPQLPAGTESLELSARHPNGKVEILLLARDIPLEWPTSYVYETPVPLPSGTVLSLTAQISNLQAAAVAADLRLTVSARRH